MLKQISIFLTNQPGMLSSFTKLLMDNKVNMRAISVAETADYGILRILVDKVDECVKILKTANYLVSVNEVIAVNIPDTPGALHEITKTLGDASINIEYLYSTLVKDKAIVVLRVDDNEKATKVLKSKGIQLIQKQEF